MYNFKLLKRNMLIKIMTFLGFGGMAAFCIASCQQVSSNSDKQPSQESTHPQDSVQSASQSDHSEDSPATTADAQKPEPQNDSVNNNTEPVQDVSNPDTDLDSSDTTQMNPEPTPDPVFIPTEYGIRHPRSPLSIKPTKPISPNPQIVREELRNLNRTMKTSCHPETGDLVVEFTLTPAGKATNIKSLNGSLKGTKSEQCILNQLSKHQFPEKADKNTPVKFPFKIE